MVRRARRFRGAGAAERFRAVPARRSRGAAPGGPPRQVAAGGCRRAPAGGRRRGAAVPPGTRGCSVPGQQSHLQRSRSGGTGEVSLGGSGNSSPGASRGRGTLAQPPVRPWLDTAPNAGYGGLLCHLCR